MLAIAALLAGLAATNWMTPWGLLGLTFLLGLGGAFSAPAWQAIVPQLVPKQELAMAVALNSAGFNLARAIGPALGGLLVAATGPAVVFLINAASFLGVIIVIYCWQPAPQERAGPAERMRSAVAAGLRFARYAPPLRAVLARTAAFTVAASALWALLPVVATRQLRLGASGYGILLGSIGLGAVAGAILLPHLQARLSVDRLVVALTLVFAGGMIALASLDNLLVLTAALVAVGIAWLTVNSSLNIAARTAAPAWVQARALGVYLLVFQGGLAGGSAGWGIVAGHFDERSALLAAAGVLLLSVAAVLRWPLPTGEEMDLSPSQHWPEPELALELEAEDGLVLVTIEYRVAAPQQAAFRRAMTEVQTIRLRDGATRWGLFRDAADPERFLETFFVASWAEHLRQHARVTVADREVEERALALQQPGTLPVVSHFIATDQTKL
jgi:MFS family permease